MRRTAIVALFALAAVFSPAANAADGPAFDFARIEKVVREFSAILDMYVEISMGTHTGEQKVRLLATVVTDDGLIIFNGEGLSDESGPPGMSGLTVKITTARLTARMLEGDRYEAEFLGVDRFTHIGFGRIKAPAGVKFRPVKFSTNTHIPVGAWLGLYMLLPEFASPPLAADVGMVAAQIESPERFALTVGLGPAQMTSVLFDRNYVPVGVVGSLPDPGQASSDAGGMLQDMGESDIPLIGVIPADRLAKLIADPPLKGKTERSWLGISLQALTKDLSEYMHLPVSQGIIVNEVLRGSPAAKAGLAIGDVIYALDGRTIAVDKEERVSTGDKVQFSVYRQSVSTTPQQLTVPITLERAPLAASDAPEYENKKLEFSVREMVLSDYIANNIVDSTLKGAVVSRLKPGGLAQVGGLRLGDIVQRIGTTTVVSIDDARTAMDMVDEQKPSEVVFFVWRDNKTMFINLKTS
jgi:S1-C subfamily serine protease